MKELLSTQDYLTWALALIAFGTTIWNWLMSGARANAKAIKVLETSATEAKQRIRDLENTVATMPGKDDMHQLQLQLSTMSGDMKALLVGMDAVKESQDRLHSIVSRHEDHLRDH